MADGPTKTEKNLDLKSMTNYTNVSIRSQSILSPVALVNRLGNLHEEMGILTVFVGNLNAKKSGNISERDL